MPDGAIIRLDRRVRAGPGVVYRHLTEAALWVRWQGVAGDIEARPGGRFSVLMPGGQVAEGSFVRLEPDRRVVFTWGWSGDDRIPPGSSTVEIELVPDGDGTIVRLTHRGLPAEAEPPHRSGWQRYLERLATLADGADPGPDDGAS